MNTPCLKSALFSACLAVSAWAGAPFQVSGGLGWSVRADWDLPARPLAIAHASRRVFVLCEDGKVHVFAPNGRKEGELPVGADIQGIEAAPDGETLYLASGRDRRVKVVSLAFAKAIDISGAPALGPAQAPVTLVVFSDFECPWCAKEVPVLQELLAKNPGKLRIVFKHAPLPTHARAEGAALAAIAAQLQDKFWPMHDALFAATPWTADTIQGAALKAGLDMDLFRLDQAGPEPAARLAKDRKDARQAGVTSVPALFMNGYPVRQRSLASLQSMMDGILSGPGGVTATIDASDQAVEAAERNNRHREVPEPRPERPQGDRE